jgi:GxxExxY protein
VEGGSRSSRLRQDRVPFSHWPTAQEISAQVYDEDGTLIGDDSTNLFVDNRLIIELKAAKALADERVAQILGYLRSSRVEHGLLINFGAPKFEIKKYALSRIGEGRPPGGLTGGVLSLFASLAPFRGYFNSGF